VGELETLKSLLERHGLKPDKSLGQHYLISSRVINSIVLSVAEGASVLEVGPGPGVLSQPLFERALPMKAIEIDPISVAVLGERMPELEVIRQDALKADFTEIACSLPEPRWLVSNMPYHITGPLLTLFTQHRRLFLGQTLMMQKEVAQKIMATPGEREMGSISVYLQSRFQVSHRVFAPSGTFFPPPKVDSQVLLFIPSNALSDLREDAWHEKIVRAGFIQPRKTLANNLGTLLGKNEGVELINSLGLAPSIRPHQVTLETWFEIAKQSGKLNES